MKIGRTIRASVVAGIAGLGHQAAFAEDGNPLAFTLSDGATVTAYGYAKVTHIEDFDFDLGDTISGLRDIGLPAGPAAGRSTRTHLKESRIGVVYEKDDLEIRLEGDFFGADGLRLRLGYVDWNGFLVGQDWSNFMPNGALPSTVDFTGPASVPFARIPQVKYTFSPREDWALSVSVEEDVGNSADVHYTASAQKWFESGTVKLAGMYRDATVAKTPVEGWGLSLSGYVEPWDGGTLGGVLTTGEGIADILAFALDGNALSVGGNAVGVNGIAVGVSQKVGDRLLLAAQAGMTRLDVATGTDTKSIKTLHLSAFYDVTDAFQLSAEYITGTREQGDGTKFDADRVMVAAKYSF